MRRCIRPFLVIALLAAAPPVFADAGELDPLFGDGGMSTVNFDEPGAANDELAAMATTPDGRIVAVGLSASEAFQIPLRLVHNVVRLDVDGTLDRTFADGGRLSLRRWFVQSGILTTSAGLRASIDAVAVQADGRIVLAGYATTATSAGMLVARLTAAGAPDTTFGDGDGIVIVPFDLGGPTNSWARAVAIQPDGKIVVAGSATPDGGDSDIAVARLGSDGRLDKTFGAAGRATVGFDLGSTALLPNDDEGVAMALQADGKVVVAGSAQTPNGIRSAVVRLTAVGVPDPSFGNFSTGRSLLVHSNGQSDTANAIAISELPTRRIVVAGHSRTGNAANMVLGMLDGNGIPDPAFGVDGRMTIPFGADGAYLVSARALRIQTILQTTGGFPVITRRIVVAGSGSAEAPLYSYCALARVKFNGTLDATFGTGGTRMLAFVQDGTQRPSKCAALDGQGTMAIVGGSAYLFRPLWEKALLFGRVVLEP